jgi:uncharacterized tellurite resistance protein B-like protein
MLEKIKLFFEKHIALTGLGEGFDDKLKTASAALFMEMMHTEEACTSDKQHLILNILVNTFSLTEEQAAHLLVIAEHKRNQATDYYEFTHLINAEFSHEQKIQLLESLWQIAYLDNNLDIDEEYLVDKIARLLFIPRIDVLQARNRGR